MEVLTINIQSAKTTTEVIINGLVIWVARGAVNYKMLTEKDLIHLSSSDYSKVYVFSCPLKCPLRHCQ